MRALTRGAYFFQQITAAMGVCLYIQKVRLNYIHFSPARRHNGNLVFVATSQFVARRTRPQKSMIAALEKYCTLGCGDVRFL